MKSEARQARHTYLRPTSLALVFSGGVLGVLARELLMFVVPDTGDLPVAVFVANLVGALLLGMLLEALAADTESRRAASLRVLFGTGVLGGFTTYSAVAQVVALLLVSGSGWLALGYGLATVLLGAVATWCGVVFGARIARARSGVTEHG